MEEILSKTKIMKTIFILMLPLYFGPVCTDLITTPKNEALLKGTSVELVCRVNSSSLVSSWTFTAAGSNKDFTICSREIGIVNNVTSFRKATDKDGLLNMKTDSAQPQDAGIYTCNIRLEDDSGVRIVQRSAHLIVLDSDPNCTAIDYSANGRKFKRLSCSVGFRGNWVPVMEWRQGGYNGTIVTTGVENITSGNSTTCILTIPLEASEANALSYTCITFFSVYLGNISATASNIPDYAYTWSEAEPTSKTTHFDKDSTSRRIHLTELTGALAAVVGVLLMLLVIISARNYRKYNRANSALAGEARPINGENAASHNRLESVMYGIRNGLQEESSGCSRFQENGLSLSACGRGKQEANQAVSDKSSCSYFAADGTEYMELSSGQNNYRQQMPARYPSRYAQVFYASIDHTLKVPPPPVKK